MRRSTNTEEERQEHVQRNPKRRILKEYEWRRRSADLEEPGNKAKYVPSAKHKLHPERYDLAVTYPRDTLCMMCDRDGGFHDMFLTGELLKKAFAYGLVDQRMKNQWPLHIWGIWKEIVFEAHWENNGSYHGYPLEKIDPMWDVIKDTCSARNYIARCD